jgi:multidrug efflux pump subunit AcrA (membrane-fusion protein)
VQEVKPGPSADGFTEILSGVQSGQNIVLDGQSRLAPGVTVAVGPSG